RRASQVQTAQGHDPGDRRQRRNRRRRWIPAERVDTIPPKRGGLMKRDSVSIVFVLGGFLSMTGAAPALRADDTCSGGRAPACRDIVVLTERGPVRGTVGDGLAVFLGVPYAAPPVGGLRWRPPIQHSPWFRPVDAKSFGSPCPQVEEFWSLPSLN